MTGVALMAHRQEAHTRQHNYDHDVERLNDLWEQAGVVVFAGACPKLLDIFGGSAMAVKAVFGSLTPQCRGGFWW